jgi:adenylosuccinate synthase
MDELQKRGHDDVDRRLALSDRAHLILPYHIEIDGLREAAAGAGAIGTTKKGIGPAYEDKVRRKGVRAGDLRDLARLQQRVDGALQAWAPIVQALGGEVPKAEAIVADLAPLAKRLVPLLVNSSRLVEQSIRDGARVMLEGAQGTLLDIDHGTYPYVTSSSAVSGGAAIGAGIGPNRIKTVIGITKAYTTRVGGGPFPTELDDEIGKHLRDVGDEYGSVTRRPRRTGWLDLPGLRYAARINGLDGLAITKLDVLTGLAKLRACVAYETPDGRTDEFPIDLIDEPGAVKPIYEDLPGWKEPLTTARTLDALPGAARDYVRFIESQVGVPAFLVGVGPRRDETIVVKHPFDER